MGEDRERFEELRDAGVDKPPPEQTEPWNAEPGAVDDLVAREEWAGADVDGSVPGDSGYDATDFNDHVAEVTADSIVPGDVGATADRTYQWGQVAVTKGSCLGCAGVGLVVAIIGAVIGYLIWSSLTAAAGGGSAQPRTDGEQVAAAPAVEDLALVEGPWRIRNDDLVVGGASTGYTSVDRGTFTLADGGAVLIGTPEAEGEAALTFALTDSSPDQRTYETSFMGATYTIVFDEPGHFTGEIVLEDGTIQRQVEGWSELDEQGEARSDLPELSEASGPSVGTGSGGTVGSGCTEAWMPADFTLSGVTFGADPGQGCAGLAIGSGAGEVADLIAAEADRLGTDATRAGDGSLVLGCVGGVGPVRFELQEAGDATLVVATEAPGGC
ncbi:hypothetical protein [Agromyces sp. SYSU T00194]|uniref:hypothetical protein n=1 Tax=Agromyces chitinivorans TaxID=3158560 RepID=UPI003397DBAC